MITPLEMKKCGAEIINLFPDNISNTPNNEFSEKPTPRQVLLALGIRSNHQGFKYLRSAIELALLKSDYVDSITKWTYPAVARKYRSRSIRVERAIRYSISKAEPANEFKLIVFPWITDKNYHLTNKEFISGVVEYLRCYDEDE